MTRNIKYFFLFFLFYTIFLFYFNFQGILFLVIKTVVAIILSSAIVSYVFVKKEQRAMYAKEIFFITMPTFIIFAILQEFGAYNNKVESGFIYQINTNSSYEATGYLVGLLVRLIIQFGVTGYFINLFSKSFLKNTQ